VKEKEKNIETQEIEEDVINIDSRSNNETERMLSNLAHTPFDLNGKHYESVEGFWQGLRFPEDSEDRKRIALLFGVEAKKVGNSVSNVQIIEYRDKKVAAGSPEHHELMRQAIRAKLEQNPAVLKLLLETGNKKITHKLKKSNGEMFPDSKHIPAAIFTQILMDLREEFR
jgi:predicted NAD-dependent protein-ADP-ribosyltransferase YbiA (DUF1768 family)